MNGPSVEAVAALLDIDPQARTVRVNELTHRAAAGHEAVGDVTVFLYTALHAGNQGIFATDAILPDPEFEAEIMAAISDPGMLVGVQPVEVRAGHPNDVRIVDLERIRLAVPDPDLAPAEDGGLRVRIPCSRPNLSPGFFMFGHDSGANGALGGEVTRYYIRHDDADRALADWAGCLERLTAAGLSFRTKLLSRRSAYPRNDALVFYAGQDEEGVREIVTTSADARPVASGGSPLCADLGSGVTRADDPRDPRPAYGGHSFGEHRCRVIAEAVVDVLDGGPSLEAALTRCCELANVDASDLAANRL